MFIYPMQNLSKNSREKYNFENAEKIIETICITKEIKYPSPSILERIIILDYWIANLNGELSKETLRKKVLKDAIMQKSGFLYNRTFGDDIKQLNDLGLNIKCDSKTQKYNFIENEIGPLCKIDKTDPQFYSTMSLLQQKLPSTSSIISKGFGTTNKSGQIKEYQDKIKVNPIFNDVSHEILHKVLEAISNRKVLKLIVKGNDLWKISHIFHPYFVKEFENNLYVLGCSQVHPESSYTRKIEKELTDLKKGIDFRLKNIIDLENKLKIEKNDNETKGWIQTQIEHFNKQNQEFKDKLQKIIKQKGKLHSISISSILEIQYELEESMTYELDIDPQTMVIVNKLFEEKELNDKQFEEKEPNKELPKYNGTFSPEEFYLTNVYGYSFEELKTVIVKLQILKSDLDKFKNLSIVDFNQYKISEINVNSFQITFETIMNKELHDLLYEKEANWIKILVQ